MSQIHRRFTDEQVKVLLQGYCQGQLARTDLQDLLGIGKSSFFALLKAYRQGPEGFTIAYRRSAPARLSSEVEEAIKAALLREKAIVEDPDLHISSGPDVVNVAMHWDTRLGTGVCIASDST